MHCPVRLHPAAALAAALLVPAAALARGEPTRPAFDLGVGHDQVFYDAPGDGSLWARGASYKLSFDAQGATYYPALGARQTRNVPHAMSPDLVTVGGTPLAFERAAVAQQRGDRVELDRGSFVEAYELEPESLEQLFVFPSLPRGGDLVVHIPIASELAAREQAGGIEFQGEHGRVTYSSAVTIDAAGRRAPAATELEGDAIVIRVDASVLASASFPLVIDPVVSLVSVNTNSSTDDIAADVAWDDFHQVWIIVYEEVFSATDSDVFAHVYGKTGNQLLVKAVDVTTESWTAPRCADLRAAKMFLVVSGVTTTAGSKSVKGRTCQPNGTLLVVGPSFDIGGTGVVVNPDVGGDPAVSGSTGWCVVVERDLKASGSEVGVRLVGANGVPIGTGPTYFSRPLGAFDSHPNVSKSNDAREWLVAWQRLPQAFPGPATHDVVAARVNADGSIPAAAFNVAKTSSKDFEPAASSPLHQSSRAAVAFTRNVTATNNDVMVAIVDGSTVVTTINISVAEGLGTQGLDQQQPSIDCDGQRFLVAYSEQAPSFPEYDVFVTDLFLSGDTVGVSQKHEALLHLGLSEHRSSLSAAHSLGATTLRYLGVFDYRNNATEHDVVGALYDRFQGGATSVFCPGDGSVAACPCGNNGNAGSGCGNSVQAGGAKLVVSGTASTVNDTLRLQVIGVPPQASCLFLQGMSANPPTPFTDGLFCLGGPIIRLGVKKALLGAAGFPTPGEPGISVTGSVSLLGGLRTYQVWYRDNAVFCTNAAANVSGGVTVLWAP